MAEARGRDEWGRMSSLLALLANVNRDPKRTRPFKPADFNPYEVRRPGGVPLGKGNMRLLKQVFVDRKGEAT
ncbi:MAG: hypothetical protein FJ288_16385 [Planctomycetes bacterium]|nr:hypothetical protein [Planctomycetota bacterium]